MKVVYPGISNFSERKKVKFIKKVADKYFDSFQESTRYA